MAVYKLLATLDPNLQLADASAILHAASQRPKASLERVVNALGDLLHMGTEISEDNREELYGRIQGIEAGSLGSEYQGLRIVSLANGTASEIEGDARVSIAYRYALVQLDPFVITGKDALYQPHNANGALDLYNPETGEGALSEKYLKDRAEFLSWKLLAGEQDETVVRGPGGAENREYVDLGQGYTLEVKGQVLGFDSGAPARKFVFGDMRSQSLQGGSEADRLYGGGGVDILEGGAGDDYIEGNAEGDILRGGAGTDTLEGGLGDDTLEGGPGDDVLHGGIGEDEYILRAGEGNDTIFDQDGLGRITFIDSNGNRVTLSLSAQAVPGEPNTWRSPYPEGGEITYTLNSPLTIHLPDGTSIVVEDFSNGQLGIDLRPEAPEVRETIVGGVGDEFLYPQSYEARQLGNAKIEGQAGHDALSGTLGVDFLDGGEGNDAMSAGLGDDRIIGGAGNDVIDTGPGKDIVEAGEGDDLVTSSFAIDIRAVEVTAQGTVTVSLHDVWPDIARHYNVTVINPDLPSAAADGYLHWAFNPSIGSEPWTEALPAGRVYDEVAYAPDATAGAYGGTLTYRDNNPDPLSRLPARVYRIDFPYVGQPNADPKLLSGRTGNDRLLGADGADVIYGEADQDLIEGNAGEDALFGGPGDDQVVAGADDDYVSGDTGNDRLWGESGSDRIYGGEGNDYIEGDSGASVLYTHHGDDVIDGEAGDDTLFGQGGSDTLYGGDGNDQLIGDQDSLLTQYHGHDTLYGGGGNDRLWGDGGNDTLYGGDGDDHTVFGGGLIGGTGNDILFGEAGRDELQGGDGDDNLSGGTEDDLLLGGAGDDQILGDAGADELQGGDGQDSLEGGEGADLLFGEAGNDELSGGTGDDALYGEAGDDVYVFNVGDGVDSIDDTEGVNRIRFGAGIDLDNLILGQTWGANGEQYLAIRYGETDLLYINPGLLGANFSYELADGSVLSHGQLIQRAPALSVTGSAQNDVIDGGPQNDSLSGKSGDDTLRGAAGDDNLYGGLGSDVLEGGDGNDKLLGYEPYSMVSELGNDALYGGLGADRMFGGLGDDVYLIHRGDGIDEIGDGTDVPAGGFDTLRFGAGVLPEHVALYRTANDLRLVLDNGPQQIVISSFFNASYDYRIEQFVFDDGNGPVWTLDDINARAIVGSANVMTGTTGNDSFSVDHTGDTVSEAPAGGIDTIESWVNYTLPSNVENLILTGPLHINGTGNAFDNVLRGNNGNHVLDGGAGYDTAYGGAGDDIYKNIEAVVENPDEGIDTWISRNGGVLPANVENLSMDDNSGLHYIYNVSAIGNTLDNTLTSGGFGVGGDILDGREGADTMIASGSDSPIFVVDNVGDKVIASSRGGYTDKVISSISYQLGPYVESLTLTGMNAISGTGNERINTLDGSSNVAPNLLAGREGDDTYIIGPGDIVVEAAGEGNDTVQIATWSPDSGRTYTLEDLNIANVEVFGLTGYGINITLVGDAESNTLKANPTKSTTLVGGAGDDSLFGGDGDDRLDGGAGADSLHGGGGNGWDTYVVDDTGDRIYDYDTGYDTVMSSISYTLGGSLEELVLTGVEPISGTGNAMGNRLDGSQNPAPNLLAGGAGNDLYVIDAGDSIVEDIDGGTDEVWSRASIATLVANVENAALIGHEDEHLSAIGNELDNRIQGDFGDNALSGGDGNDTLTGSGGNDTISGGAGNDTLDGWEGEDFLDGGDGDDTYLWGRIFGKDTIGSADAGVGKRDVVEVDDIPGNSGISGDIIVTQNADDLVLRIVGTEDQLTVRNYFASANPTTIEEFRFSDGVIWTASDVAAKFIRGSFGNDTLVGTAANDNIAGLTGDDALWGGAGHDILNGDEGADSLYGEAGTDTLMGGSGADLLDGGSGGDSLQGGVGDDTYIIDDAGDVVIENGDEGMDTVKSSVTYTLAANVENLILTGTATLNGTGNALDNVLTGNSAKNVLIGGGGNDLLDGGSSADTLSGGAGDDSYVVDDTSDVVSENPGEGTDTVSSSVTYTLAANVENLALTGLAAINGTGNALNNALAGNSANNTLDGGVGSDTLAGGAGNDTYVVDDPGDMVIENVGEGTDTVKSNLSYVLGAYLEHLVLTGTAAVNGTGNGLGNTLTGNSAANILSGGSGTDTLIGNAGNDYLDGGTEADQLTGGAGDDTYIVDVGGDVVTEKLNEGVDTVQSAVTLTLGANLESLILIGTGAIDGTGNGLSNVLMGNSADNTLKGGAGADMTYGGAGNDLYIVDNSGDIVVENPDDGVDSVQSSVTWTLSANSENLTLTGSSAINGTGNSLDNILTGNSAINVLRGDAGNDVLDGKAGADTLYGGAGDDTYIVGSTGDVATENAGEGVDTVKSSVTYTLAANIEHLTLTGTSNLSATGNALDNTLTGNGAANTLTALAGDDLLDGGAGTDTLRGGTGNDTYVVDNTGDKVIENAAEGVDTVQSGISYTLPTEVEHLFLTGSGALNGTGNSLDNTIQGNSAGNALSGGSGADVLEGGAGNDTLMGGSGGDRYLFKLGDGRDLIQEQAGVAGEDDSVHFGPGIDPDELWFSRSGDDLSVTVLGGTDGITVQKWYSGPEYRLEEFHTADGSVLYESQVQQLVQAMAAFNPPAAGETELSPQMREQLEPVLAASWETQAA